MDELIGVLLEAIFAPLLAIIGHALLGVMVYLIIIPIFCVLSTPMVFICAIFGPGNYADKVVSGYKGICVGVAGAGD